MNFETGKPIWRGGRGYGDTASCLATSDGRLIFSARLIDEALAGLRRGFTLYGQKAGHELVLSGKRVYMGTGGAAPQIVDLETGLYRPSTLRDLYDAARIVDAMDNIHFFSRPLVARDMADDRLLDVNTAYASLAGDQWSRGSPAL